MGDGELRVGAGGPKGVRSGSAGVSVICGACIRVVAARCRGGG